MTTLRESVSAWQAQEVKCRAAFDAAKDGIKRELDAVGGYATTSPNERGHCGTFWWHEKEAVWSTGAVKAGEDRHGERAPSHPEVGDRCDVLYQAWRTQALALTEACRAVRDNVAARTGKQVDHARCDDLALRGIAPEHVALALVLESGNIDAVRDAWADEMARADALRRELNVVRTEKDGVWKWQGEGDDPESLGCPVVMSADTLRAMLDRIQELEKRCASTAIEVPQPQREDVDPETIVRMHLDDRPPRKYIPVDGAEMKEIVNGAIAQATEVLTSDEWDDGMLPEDDAIKEAFPTRSGKHAAYAEAMRLVGAKRSKGALVKLVTWLLVRIEKAEKS